MDDLYKNFQDPSTEFQKGPRSFVYDLALQMISEAKDNNTEVWYQDESIKKGILLLLYTWNH